MKNDAIRTLARKLGAFDIIFACPPWPQRDDLSETGKTLFDLMVVDAKRYALHVVDDEYPEALALLVEWSKALNVFIDATMISGNEHAEQMVRVYRYYAGALKIDFNAIVQEG